MAALKVTLVRSMSGHTVRHRATLTGLGLTRVGKTRILPDTKATRGMIDQVGFLVKWEPTDQPFVPFGKRAQAAKK